MRHIRLPLPTKPPKILRTRLDAQRTARPTSRTLLDETFDDSPSPFSPRRDTIRTHASDRP